MSMKIPPGFQPVTLDEMLQRFQTAALGEMLWTHLQLPEAVAREQIVALEAKGLIQFAISPEPQPEPAMFTAPTAVFQSPADLTAVEALLAFWDHTGKFDNVRGQIVREGVPRNMSTVHTPQGSVALLQSIAIKLWRSGVVTEEKGRLVASSKAELLASVETQGVCDFCSDPSPLHTVQVPSFEMFPGMPNLPQSEGDWAACDACYTLIAENRREDLLQRVLTHSSGGVATTGVLRTLHARFWRQMDLKAEAAGAAAGITDFIENRDSPEKPFINPAMQDKANRIEAVRRMTGLSPSEMEAMQRGDVLHKQTASKLAAWTKRYTGAAGEQRVSDFLNKTAVAWNPIPSPLHGHQPHWQVALDRKVEALQQLSRLDPLEKAGEFSAELIRDITEDVKALRLAEVYSFNADTLHAIQQGADTIPHESTLKSVEIPSVQAGWFWFAEPLAVASSPMASDSTHALLWTWEAEIKAPVLRFSTYVVDDKSLSEGTQGSILPSTKWYWPIDLSFHEMLSFNRRVYRKTYAKGTPDSLGKEFAVGEQATMLVVAHLSLFFLMSCLWFRQTVPGAKKKIDPKLTQTSGHIERHARKRYEKAFKSTPTVHVIALRKSAVEREPSIPTSDEKRHLTVRFVVRGHARLQACGPGMKDHRLIWIDAYPKGPDDAPFKPPSDRVWAVVR